MGHTAEEKIKILYEDSLKEIRGLATRIEEVKRFQEEFETEITSLISSMPAAANKEMQRAGEAALQALSAEVGNIARRLAGDAAAAEKADAFSLAFKMATVGIVVSAIIFGSTGYLLRKASDSVKMSTMEDQIAAADRRADEAVSTAEKNASNEIALTISAAKWAGTEEGRLAHKFFVNGSGRAVIQCDSPKWEVRNIEGEQWCIPMRRDLFSGDKREYGWELPQ